MALSLIALAWNASAADQILYPPDGGVAMGDAFGANLAMSGEWAVAGAPQDAGPTIQQKGSAYVFRRTQGTWAFHSKLRMPESAPSSLSQFGTLVAIQGNVIVVAAPVRMFVYRLTNNVWQWEADWQLPTSLGADSSLVVTAEEEILLGGTVSLPSLSVACYGRTGQTWSLRQSIPAPAGVVAAHQFAEKLATRDGVLLVSCQGSAAMAGKVFEYQKTSGSWQHVRTVQSPTSTAGDNFGGSLQIAAGRVLTHSTSGSTSTLHVYQIDSSGWTLQRSFPNQVLSRYGNYDGKTTALSASRAFAATQQGLVVLDISAPQPADWSLSGLTFSATRFTALACEGDTTLVCNRDNLSNFQIGAIYPLAWEPQPALGPPVPMPLSYEFGGASDIQDDLAIIGNPHVRDARGQIQGVAYILERGPTGWQVVKTLLPPETGDNFSRFGTQVTVSGNRVAIGDSHFGEDDVAAGHTGRVYVYEKQGSTWPDQPAYVIEPSQPDVFSFGQSHAFSGEYLAVTEFARFQSVQSLLRVKTYRLHNGQVTPLGVVESIGEDYFGFEMSLHGSELAILNAHNGMLLPPTKGTVFLYNLSGGAMQQTAALPVPMAEGDFFSTPKVRLEGDRLMVWKTTPPGAGGVFFKRTTAGWRPTSELRPPQASELSEYSVDMAGNALVTAGRFGIDLYLTSEPPRLVRRLDTSTNFYSLCNSRDTALLIKANQVLIKSLQSLLASDSVVVDSYQASSPGGNIYLGALVAGHDCKVEVELQNAGTEPLALTGVQLTPVQGANSVKAHEFTPVTLAPLGRTKVKLTLNPPSPGIYEMSLQVLHPDAAQNPYVFTVSFEARDGDFAPQVSETWGGVLIAKGDPVLLQADTTGPRGRFNCQWYKDGRALAGSTQPHLYIASAQPAHAGRYRLDVWSPGSSRKSCTMALGVFERQASAVLAKAGESINFTARFWGPGIRVRWVNANQNYQPIPETWAIQGTQSATLSISSAMALAGTVPLRIGAELIMEESASVIANDHVIELLRVPVIAVTGIRNGRVGAPLNALLLSDLTEHPEGAVFSAEGLPPGVQLTSGGYRMEGTPTQAGNYAVKIMAENRYGSAVPFRLNLKIYADTDEPTLKLHFGTSHKLAGIAMIPESRQGVPEWPALVQVQSSTGTGFSGSLAFGTVRRPFSGQWSINNAEASRSATLRLAPFLGYRSVVLTLSESAVEETFPTSGINAGLVLEHMSPEAGSAASETWLEPLVPLFKEWSHALAGRYSFLMGGFAGQGFGSFSVGSDFSAIGTGTLADGTTFTFSMPMVMGQNGPSNGTVMLVRLGAGPVRLWGRISTMASGGGEAGLVSGTLTMVRPEQPGARLLPEAINTEIPVRGARYFVPKGVPLFTPSDAAPEQVGRTPLTLVADGLPESVNTALTFTKAGKVIVDKPNPWDLRLDVYMPTGFFTGSFKVNEPVPGTENRFVRRTVPFSGMMVPQLRTGGGFFHFSPLPNRLAEPPTTSATTPIYVGGVTLE
ncbi:MAG: hypothetical protein V4662_01870 [Verrucomicrobiota bacterium]